jgi:hypothetical protein
MRERVKRRSSAETQTYWREQVTAYEASGLTQKAFCQQRRIAERSFRKWIQQIRREQRAGREERPAFIPVTLKSDAQETREPVALKVVLPGDITIVVSEGSQVPLLRHVVKALR